MGKYTKEQLLDLLRQFHREHNRSPTSNDFKKRKPGHSTFFDYFGSWNNAISEAGLEKRPRGGNIKETNEQMICKVKEFYIRNKRTPMASDFPSTYCFRFGKWNNVLKAAGIPANRKMDYTEEELLQILRGFYAKNHRAPTKKDLTSKNAMPSQLTFHRVFGGYNKALTRAGIPMTRFVGYTPEIIIKRLKEFAEEHNRIPKAIDFNNYSPTYQVIIRVLGVKNWSDVLSKAGFEKKLWARSNSLAFKWERFVGEVVKELFSDAIRKREFVIDGIEMIPDNYIPSKNLIIEAKLSDYNYKKISLRQIMKYQKISPNIEFWCLQRLDNQERLPVKCVYADQLQTILSNKGYSALAKKCKAFINLDPSIREEAGLWTRELLLREFFRFKDEFGRLPTDDSMTRAKGYPTASTYKRVFGMPLTDIKVWLGYEKDKLAKEAYGKEEIKQAILEFNNRHGRLPWVKEFRHENGLPSTHAVSRVFGSLINCWEYCGFSSKVKNWTKESILKAFRDYHSHHGRIPSSKKLAEQDNLPNPSACRYHFGGWNNAIIAAGLQVPRKVDWRKDELISILQKFMENRGRAPTSKELPSIEGCPDMRVFADRFGSWNNALIAAGLSINRKRWTDEELLQELRDYHRKHCKLPTTKVFLNPKNNHPTPPTYDLRFGSWSKALELAGLKKKKGKQLTLKDL